MSWKNGPVSGSAAEEKKTEFQTPPKVCKYMASLIPAGTKKVLEPTPGIGNLVSSIRDAGDYARITTCVIQLQKGYTGPVQFSRFNY
jgi:type I restriction-modification system DNA methylase subunit